MPDTIAQLDIQITSTAKSADDAITRLQSRIGALGSALSGLTTVGTSIGHIESSMGRLKSATDGLDAGKLKDTAASLSNLAKAADKFSTSGVGNITVLSSALRELSSVGEVGDFSGVTSLINSVTRMSKATIDPAQFTAIGAAITELTNTVSTAPEISERITAFLSAIARLGGRSIANAPANIGAISVALDEIFHAMATVPEVRDDVLRFVEALGSVSPAMRSVRTATTRTSSGFSDFKKVLKIVSDSFKSTVDTFVNGAKKISGAVTGLFKGFSGNGFMSGPIGTMLRFAATFFTIQRAWEALKSSISNASALVEIQNVINAVYSSGERAFTGLAGEAQTAAEHLDELAKGAINAYGISELAFKRYASQFQAMGTALGITNEQVANAEANLDKWGVMVSKVKDPVTGLNKEFGTMTGQMSDMSMTLTQLAGDIASFYDKDVADVQKMLASGIYSGQTRPLRALGLDLTQANVQAWALAQGLNADMQTMTQSEKVMLRYQYVLSSLGFVMGDFAYTADKLCVA